MAVELRCPGCRAKLRLPTAPEEGSEIECPKCGQVFAADAAGVPAARGGGDEPKPRKKPSGDAPEKPKKKKAGETSATASPRRRKLKKRKSNPYVLYGAVGGGLLLLGIFIGAIIWFFNRTSASQEMMLYLPDDCDEVSGINLGHLQKYPEFYKTCENSFGNTGFKRAADMFSRALGQETNDTITYVVQGNGRVGGTGQGVSRPRFSAPRNRSTRSFSANSQAPRRERATESITTSSPTSPNSATAGSRSSRRPTASSSSPASTRRTPSSTPCSPDTRTTRKRRPACASGQLGQAGRPRDGLEVHALRPQRGQARRSDLDCIGRERE